MTEVDDVRRKVWFHTIHPLSFVLCRPLKGFNPGCGNDINAWGYPACASVRPGSV